MTPSFVLFFVCLFVCLFWAFEVPIIVIFHGICSSLLVTTCILGMCHSEHWSCPVISMKLYLWLTFTYLCSACLFSFGYMWVLNFNYLKLSVKKKGGEGMCVHVTPRLMFSSSEQLLSHLFLAFMFHCWLIAVCGKSGS